jgi:CBS domain-containing protein
VNEEVIPMLVREVMSSPVVTVGPRTPVKQAVRLLDEHRITSMPVVDEEGRLVGVVSEADVLRDALPPDRRTHERLVELAAPPVHLVVTDVMTHLPMSVGPDDDLVDAVELMVDTQVKSLPVVSSGRVVGMVSRRDVIAVLARQDGLIEAEVDEALREAGVECVVEVDDGLVILRDGDDPERMHVAQVIASRIPGVVGVSIGSLA